MRDPERRVAAVGRGGGRDGVDAGDRVRGVARAAAGVAEHQLRPPVVTVVRRAEEGVAGFLPLRAQPQVVDVERGRAAGVPPREALELRGPRARRVALVRARRARLGLPRCRRRGLGRDEHGAGRAAQQLRRHASHEEAVDDAASVRAADDQIRPVPLGEHEQLLRRLTHEGDRLHGQAGRCGDLSRELREQVRQVPLVGGVSCRRRPQRALGALPRVDEVDRRVVCDQREGGLHRGHARGAEVHRGDDAARQRPEPRGHREHRTTGEANGAERRLPEQTVRGPVAAESHDHEPRAACARGVGDRPRRAAVQNLDAPPGAGAGGGAHAPAQVVQGARVARMVGRRKGVGHGHDRRRRAEARREQARGHERAVVARADRHEQRAGLLAGRSGRRPRASGRGRSHRRLPAAVRPPSIVVGRRCAPASRSLRRRPGRPRDGAWRRRRHAPPRAHASAARAPRTPGARARDRAPGRA